METIAKIITANIHIEKKIPPYPAKPISDVRRIMINMYLKKIEVNGFGKFPVARCWKEYLISSFICTNGRDDLEKFISFRNSKVPAKMTIDEIITKSNAAFERLSFTLKRKYINMQMERPKSARLGV